MVDEAKANEAPSMPAWVRWTAIGVLMTGVVAYVLIAAFGNEAKWGPRGDAVGPFAALFNAGALFAALWAVHLQRSELALQRQELRETREEMVEQRKQFERTAKAQEDLAASQASLARSQEIANDVSQRAVDATSALADVQREANKIALSATLAAQASARNGVSAQHAQRSSNIATYMAAMANVRASIEAARSPMSGTSSGEKDLELELLALRAQRDLEAKRCHELEQVMKDIDEDRPNA